MSVLSHLTSVLFWFVFQNGHIFVFLGLVEFVDNDDQLACVLGHEMAHALLSHGVSWFSKRCLPVSLYCVDVRNLSSTLNSSVSLSLLDQLFMEYHYQLF